MYHNNIVGLKEMRKIYSESLLLLLRRVTQLKGKAL